MKWSRRDLSLLFPAFAAAQTSHVRTLPSNAFSYQDLTARKGGTTTTRQILKGDTHSGFLVDLHETELAAAQAPHPPHHHVHEEMLLIREGMLDVTIGGRVTRLGPGSAAYIASNQEHGWRNAGNAPARYFVLALGEDKS